MGRPPRLADRSPLNRWLVSRTVIGKPRQQRTRPGCSFPARRFTRAPPIGHRPQYRPARRSSAQPASRTWEFGANGRWRMDAQCRRTGLHVCRWSWYAHVQRRRPLINAGSATIINHGFGAVTFSGTSTAGSANVINQAGSAVTPPEAWRGSSPMRVEASTSRPLRLRSPSAPSKEPAFIFSAPTSSPLAATIAPLPSLRV